MEDHHDRVNLSGNLRHGCYVGLKNSRVPGSDFEYPARVAGEDCANGVFELRSAKDFEWSLADEVTVDAEDTDHRAIRKRNSAVAIEHHDALAHCFENQFEALFSVGQLAHFLAQIAGHPVQRCPNRGNFRVSRDWKPLWQVALRQFRRGIGDSTERPGNQDSHDITGKKRRGDSDENCQSQTREIKEVAEED